MSKSVLEQTLDDGSSQLLEGQTERIFANTARRLTNESSEAAPSAVGVSLLDMTRSSSGGNTNVARTPSTASPTIPTMASSALSSRGRRLLKRSSSAASASDFDRGKLSMSDLRASSNLGTFVFLLLGRLHGTI